jgi:hypothetical protein
MGDGINGLFIVDHEYVWPLGMLQTDVLGQPLGPVWRVHVEQQRLLEQLSCHE